MHLKSLSPSLMHSREPVEGEPVEGPMQALIWIPHTQIQMVMLDQQTSWKLLENNPIQPMYMSNAHTHSKSRNSQIWIIQHARAKWFSMCFACVVGQLLCLTTRGMNFTQGRKTLWFGSYYDLTCNPTVQFLKRRAPTQYHPTAFFRMFRIIIIVVIVNTQ